MLTPRLQLGLGDTPSYCDPAFVGPLTSDQSAQCLSIANQTITNLSAGIDYRDTLLSSSGISGTTLLYAGIAIFVLMMAVRK